MSWAAAIPGSGSPALAVCRDGETRWPEFWHVLCMLSCSDDNSLRKASNVGPYHATPCICRLGGRFHHNRPTCLRRCRRPPGQSSQPNANPACAGPPCQTGQCGQNQGRGKTHAGYESVDATLGRPLGSSPLRWTSTEFVTWPIALSGVSGVIGLERQLRALISLLAHAASASFSWTPPEPQGAGGDWLVNHWRSDWITGALARSFVVTRK